MPSRWVHGYDTLGTTQGSDVSCRALLEPEQRSGVDSHTENSMERNGLYFLDPLFQNPFLRRSTVPEGQIAVAG